MLKCYQREDGAQEKVTRGGRRVGNSLVTVHDDTMAVTVVFLGGGVSESRRREGILSI